MSFQEHSPRKRRKPKYQHGEHIQLHWECDQPYEIVRGHVDEATFRRALVVDDVDPGYFASVALGPIIHCYARWSCEDFARAIGCDQVFRLYRDKAPRRFPVTIACYPNHRPDFAEQDLSAIPPEV